MSAVDQILVKLNGTLPCGCVVIGYVNAEPVDDGHVISCTSCGASWYLDELLEWQKSLDSVLRSEMKTLAAIGLGALLGGAFAAMTAKPEDSPRAFGAGATLGGIVAGMVVLPPSKRTVWEEALQQAMARRERKSK